MKTKQFLTIILIFLLFFTFSCKRIKQSDKPLYEVMTSHIWKENREDFYYHFLKDSTCWYNVDINTNNTSLWSGFSIKWRIEYSGDYPKFYVKDTYVTEDDTIWNEYEYIVVKYTEYKINTYLKFVPKENQTIYNTDSVKVVFKAVD